MDTGLVGDVRDLTVAFRVGPADDLRAGEDDPDVGFEVPRVLRPKVSKQLWSEADRALLVEIGGVACLDERSDGRRVVQACCADDELVQSGWPDSNRRLLAPKASTLTRLSYTPQVAKV